MVFSQSILNIFYQFLGKDIVWFTFFLSYWGCKSIYNAYIKQSSVKLCKQTVKLLLWCKKCSIYQYDFLNLCSWCKALWFHPCLSFSLSLCLSFSEITYQISLIFLHEDRVSQKNPSEIRSSFLCIQTLMEVTFWSCYLCQVWSLHICSMYLYICLSICVLCLLIYRWYVSVFA